MNINETIDQIERGMGGRVGEDIRAIIDAYRQMEARAEKAERALAEARRDISDAAVTFRAVNVTEALASMNIDVDVLQQWQARAEAAEAKVARLTEALDYYADRAGEGRKYRILDEHGEALGTIHHIGHKARTALKAMENTDE